VNDYRRQSPRKKIHYFDWRFRFMLLIIALIFSALIGRMVYLMVVERAFLQQQGDARAIRVVNTPAYRGMITDRNGQPLAVSSPVDTIWINPKDFQATPTQLANLAQIVNIPLARIQASLQYNKKREFMYVKRQVQPSVSEQVAALKIKGLYLRHEFKRYYPESEITAHVVGFTNIDGQGQEGMELADNKSLAGQNGSEKVVKDRLGNIIEVIDTMQAPKPGKNLQLSINMRIQYLAYRYLKAAVTKFDAQAGSIVVLDTKTNEVLAMANAPSYNPNYRPADTDGRYRNRAVTDVFEPGSTMKPFTVALALESGKYQPDTMIKTGNGVTKIAGHIVRDTSAHGTITVSDVLKYSSNIGISKIMLSLPQQSLWNLLNEMGLGMPTQSGFPGEVGGVLPFHREWNPFVLATFSFGYALSVTTLQLAHAYSILANYGVDKPISLVKLKHAPQGKQLISTKAAKEVIQMMETVVEPGGTATRAHVKGYWVAGKTGTSRMVGVHGYEWNHHNAVFAGLAPASHPRLVIVVYIHDPRKITYYGGTVAAPVFAKVMAGALRILNISPDHLPGKLQPT
tara:strand:+ start:20574 stop:22283 length:1710 start_codon:yes stop_codon:yes gene_type:complete